MRKIEIISNNKGETWSYPAIDYTAAKFKGIQGFYICAGVGNTDNKEIEHIYNDVTGNGLMVGFYRVLDEGPKSYYKQMDDLRQKSTARGYSLPPALIIGNVPPNTDPWLFRENFLGGGMNYFRVALLDKFPAVVLALNPNTMNFVMAPGNPPNGKDDNLNLFKSQVRDTKLWWWKFDGAYDASQLHGVWAAPWILSNQNGNVIEPDVTPKPIDPAPVVPVDPIALTRDQKIGALFHQIGDLFEGKE